jgi:Family of unknown function (DUF6178)
METEKPKAPGGLPAQFRQTLRGMLRRVEEKPENLLEGFRGLPLAEQLSWVLLHSGQFRQDLILSSDLARQLVSMLPDQEVYLTVKEIGLEDALPIVALMTNEQLQYLNDLEVWHKERFETHPFLNLLQMIHQSGEDRMAEWLDTVDPELLVLLLKDCGSVTKFDLTKDPVEDTDEETLITYDGYYRYHPKRQEFGPLLDPVLRILKARNPERFGMVMESAYRDVPSEVEAEASRFRSSRLSEKGIPDFEEACEIYRPLTDEQFHELAARPPTGMQLSEETPPLYPVRWLPPDSIFREVLATLGDHPETDRIRMELAGLGNKVLVAEGMEVTGVEPLKDSLKKVAGTLTLALEYLACSDREQAASWLTRAWLHHLFRLGWSQVQKLADRARRLRNRTGFAWIDRFHSLADTLLEETFKGLLKPRPSFFEGTTEEGLAVFRDFAGIEDLRITSERVTAAEAMADLFERHLRLSPERIKQTCLEAGLGDRLDTVKWSQALCSLWVIRALTGQPEFRPLLAEEVQEFLKTGFTGVPGTLARRLDPAFVDSLVRWVLDRTGPQEEAAQRIVEEWIGSGARRIEEELGGLDPAHRIDSRFVQCLCVRQQTFIEGLR